MLTVHGTDNTTLEYQKNQRKKLFIGGKMRSQNKLRDVE